MLNHYLLKTFLPAIRGRYIDFNTEGRGISRKDILDKKNHLGTTIFSSMFEKGNTTVIFKFLDEETSFWEDLQVIWKCPKGLFIKALLGRLFRF